jgi:peptidoglycan/xylan/chitin deacetylase (PgdA/CDA1 family)
MGFKKKIKKVYYTFLKKKNRLLYGRPVLVLLYHRVNDEVDSKLSKLTVSLANFEEQLLYYKKHFQILSLDDDWGSLNKTGLVVTFDDGYADNLLNALPLLEKYNIPATLFVTTLNINTINEFWWDRFVSDYYAASDSFFLPGFEGKVSKKECTYEFCIEIVSKLGNGNRDKWFLEFESLNKLNYKSRESYRSLTNSELRILSEHPLINIGLHTHHHYALGDLSYQEQKEELLLSINHLNGLVKKSIKYLAVPFGSYNDNTLAIAKDLNFKGVLLANDYYSSQKNKTYKKINRIIMPNIKGKEMVKRLKKFDW